MHSIAMPLKQTTSMAEMCHKSVDLRATAKEIYNRGTSLT